MKIVDLRILRGGRYLFLEIETDSGIVGIGEAGAWGYPEAVAATIVKYRPALLGQDPFSTEHIGQALYRSTYFRSSIVMSAISAIDIALWDIKGKALNVPVYELLGGKCRDKVRSYAPVFRFSAQEMASACKDLQDRGFTAGRLMITDTLRTGRGERSECIFARRVNSAAEKVRACREATGEGFDLCLEVHRSMSPAEAKAFAKAVEPYTPLFIEDPIPPDNHLVMAELARSTSIPIATGERFINIQEFEILLAARAASFVRPDLCTLGGITAAKKVAAIAEAHCAGVIPHNPLGPVSTAACLQLDACIPNFTIQEFPSFFETGGDAGMMVEPFKVSEGYMIIPDKPGIGIELVPDLEKKFPATWDRQNFGGQLAFDGSVKDV